MNVLILSSSDGIALTLLRCVGLNGHRGHLFSIWASSGFARRSRFCHGQVSHLLADAATQQVEDALERINDYCCRHQIDVIVPAGLWGTYFVSRYGSRFAVPILFPTSAPELISQLHNKWSFYQLLTALEVATPASFLLADTGGDDSQFTYPLMIKPVSGGNSDGVIKCESAADLEGYRLNRDKDGGGAIVLAQEYIEGYDAIFGFAANAGEIYAWTLHRKGRDFLQFFSDASVLAMARKIVSASGFSGVANFDVRFDERRHRFLIIECNPRFWASFGASKCFGVDFFELGVQMARGETPTANDPRDFTAVKNVPYPSSLRFAKGWVTGKYNASNTKLNDLAWQSLLDPLPTVAERLQRHRYTAIIDDTSMIK
jgi:hypothetical protein